MTFLRVPLKQTPWRPWCLILGNDGAILSCMCTEKSAKQVEELTQVIFDLMEGIEIPHK